MFLEKILKFNQKFKNERHGLISKQKNEQERLEKLFYKNNLKMFIKRKKFSFYQWKFGKIVNVKRQYKATINR